MTLIYKKTHLSSQLRRKAPETDSIQRLCGLPGLNYMGHYRILLFVPQSQPHSFWPPSLSRLPVSSAVLLMFDDMTSRLAWIPENIAGAGAVVGTSATAATTATTAIAPTTAAARGTRGVVPGIIETQGIVPKPRYKIIRHAAHGVLPARGRALIEHCPTYTSSESNPAHWAAG